MSAPAKHAMARFDGGAAWRDLDPLVRDRIGAMALELVAAWWAQGQAFGGAGWREGREAVGRAAEHADGYLSALLEAAVITALPPELMGPGVPLAVPSLLGPVCRVCGCSERDACEGGCSWVEPDLCSAAACGGRAR